jgi:hypothetical protein
MVGLGGLAMVLAFVEDMARQPTSGPLPMMILVLGIACVGLLAGSMAWQLGRAIGAGQSGVKELLSRKWVEVGEAGARAVVLPSPVSSVTEHTTRNFERPT